MLGNDVDVDGDVLTIVGFSAPQFGTLVDNGDGTFIYTPLQGFVGVDAFTYTVEDAAGAQATAQVYVNVLGDFSGTDSGIPGGTQPIDLNPPTDQPGIDPPAGDHENPPDELFPMPDDTAAPTPAPEFPVRPVMPGGGQAPGLPTGSPGLNADSVLQDELGDATRKTNPSKYLYDGILDGIELQGFGLKQIALTQDILWQALDDMKSQMSGQDDASNRGFVISSVIGGSSLLLTTGLISWVLRGGALASTLLSTLPLWKGMDPLPLLAGRRKEKKKSELTDTQAMDRSREFADSNIPGDAESMFTQSFKVTDETRGAGKSS